MMPKCNAFAVFLQPQPRLQEWGVGAAAERLDHTANYIRTCQSNQYLRYLLQNIICLSLI
jgi:hypothetical protein